MNIVWTGPGHRTVPPSFPPRVPVPVGGAVARLPLVFLGARPPSELASSKGFKGGSATTVVAASDHAAAACGEATDVAGAGGSSPSSFPIGAADIFVCRQRQCPVSVGTLYALHKTAKHSNWRLGWMATPHPASGCRTRASLSAQGRLLHPRAAAGGRVAGGMASGGRKSAARGPSSAVLPSRFFGYFQAIWGRRSVVPHRNRSLRFGMAGRGSGDTIIRFGWHVQRVRQRESSSHGQAPG